MAKKDGDGLTHFFSDVLYGFISGFVENVVESVQEVVEHAGRRLFLGGMYYLLLFTSVIFLGVAAVFLLSEYLIVSKGWGFLIVGLLILIAALVIDIKLKSKKRGE